jgi:hypothetical protein
MLVAFAAAVAVGLAAQNGPTTVLWRALIVMAVCYPIGRLVGSIAQKTVQDHIDRYKKEHPIPTDEEPAAETITEESTGQTEQATT